MFERLRQVRKSLPQKTNQEQFGKILGVSRDAIKTYELGLVVPSDTFIKLLCIKFGIDENWLRTGDGDMYRKTPASIIRQMQHKYALTQRESALIEVFVALPDEQRQAIVDVVEKAAKKMDERINQI